MDCRKWRNMLICEALRAKTGLHATIGRVHVGQYKYIRSNRKDSNILQSQRWLDQGMGRPHKRGGREPDHHRPFFPVRYIQDLECLVQDPMSILTESRFRIRLSA